MIQYDKDGVTLFYIDAAGKRVAHYFMEGAAYNDMVTVRDAQLQAIRENIIAKQNYELTVDNLQISVNAGHAMAAPGKPLMKSVSDTGDVLYVPFDPPLKDLLPANVGRPAPDEKKIAEVVPDKQAIQYNMILAIFRKMFPEAQ